MHPHDLARLGQAISVAASGKGNGVIPDRWIDDTLTAGNQRAWRNGEFVQLLPQGNYRNQWYLTGGAGQCDMRYRHSRPVEMESIETFERITTQFQS